MGRNRRKPFLIEKLTITDLADKGKGFGKDAEGRAVFVEDTAPGDVVDVVAKRKKKSIFLGTVEKFHTYSPNRVQPVCQHFDLCGGCKLQHVAYEAQLAFKQKDVENVIQRIGKVPVGEMLPILPCQHQLYYRNKLEFSFSSKRWLTRAEIDSGITNEAKVLGFHPSGAFDKVIDIAECFLQYEPSNFIRNTVKAIAIEQNLDFFDARANVGFLRQLMLRITTMGEIMLVLCVYEDDQKKIAGILDEIIQRIPALTSVYYCVNTKTNDFMYDLDMQLYNGKAFVVDKLGDVVFQIGPKSFFQTNTRQAEALYQVIVDFADFNGTENVYDLYTGIGSIALFIAKHCKQVVGIEEIELAIEDAKQNAANNAITNTTFYAGDVKNILTPNFAQQHGKPDILITDPPRSGMHPKVVKMLLELAAPKLIYVSCKPSTQARDFESLSEKYEVIKCQPVDMFPHTHHIENVALLQLKK
ncbi:MAG: 23S rRNA (uracil(1939)-C(5))-methyltransferase RlmD [Bacteroidota bacterium]